MKSEWSKHWALLAHVTRERCSPIECKELKAFSSWKSCLLLRLCVRSRSWGNYPEWFWGLWIKEGKQGNCMGIVHRDWLQKLILSTFQNWMKKKHVNHVYPHSLWSVWMLASFCSKFLLQIENEGLSWIIIPTNIYSHINIYIYTDQTYRPIDFLCAFLILICIIRSF